MLGLAAQNALSGQFLRSTTLWNVSIYESASNLSKYFFLSEDNWGLNLSRQDIATPHPLRGGRLLARFLQRDRGSVFRSLLENPTGYGNLRCAASLHLISKRDKCLARLAGVMERIGDIREPWISPVSGKLESSTTGTPFELLLILVSFSYS